MCIRDSVNTPLDVQRNNVYRKEINQNWGGAIPDVASSLLMGSDPGFAGGDLLH